MCEIESLQHGKVDYRNIPGGGKRGTRVPLDVGKGAFNILPDTLSIAYNEEIISAYLYFPSQMDLPFYNFG